MSENKLVYSSDGSGENLLKKNKKKKSYPEVKPEEITLKLRIEKKGRGGKSVSVIYELPDNPPYFKKLSKELKNYCGTGGSFKDTQMEIQGEQLDKIRLFLEKRGFTVKG
jgi:translation initiation factor 1